MDKTIQAAAVQFNITLGGIDANLVKAEAALQRVRGPWCPACRSAGDVERRLRL